jgi:hypothetical protein
VGKHRFQRRELPQGRLARLVSGLATTNWKEAVDSIQREVIE